MTRPRTPGIYRFYNRRNRKSLVGSSARCVYKRQREHLYDLRRGTHANRPFQTAWNRDGAAAWRFDLLELIKNPKRLIEKERRWIKRLKSADIRYGYNICVVPNSRLGTKWSPEACARRKAAMVGAKFPQLAYERSIAKTKGVPRTAEVRAKISAATKGKKRTPEQCKKYSRQKTKEEIAKMVATRRANGSFRHTKEQTEKMRLALTGRIRPPEDGAKISATKLKRYAEARAGGYAYGPYKPR